MNTFHQEIRNYVRQGKWTQAAVGFALLLSGSSLYFFLPPNPEGKKEWVVVLVAFALILIGICFLAYSLYTLLLDRDPLVQMIENQPEKIVWVYSYLVITFPFGIEFLRMGTIYFYDNKGSFYSIRVHESRLKKTMDDVLYHLPHASTGYSVDKEQLYRANPCLLYRDAFANRDN